MTFTYMGDLSTSLDKVRFYIGDTTNGTGVKPDESNFTDEELEGLIANEGSWQAAIAALAETLSILYAPNVDISIGPRSEKLSQQSDKFAKMATKWRRAADGATLTQIAPTRVDGFSQDIDAEEV